VEGGNSRSALCSGHRQSNRTEIGVCRKSDAKRPGRLPEKASVEATGLKAKSQQPKAAFLLHHSTLRDPDIVSGGVLYQVHHLVSLANDVMRGPRVVRICRQANRSPHIQVEPFLAAEATGTHGVAQTFGHHQSLILTGLWQ